MDLTYVVMDTGTNVPGKWFGWKITLDGTVIDFASDHRSERNAENEAKRWLEYWKKNIVDGKLRRPFRGPWYFLSNFYPHYMNVKIDGEIVRVTSESWYQAKKCVSLLDARRIAVMQPLQAKHAGRCVQMRPDWNEVKLGIMRRILEFKFADPILCARLVRTGNEELAEWNHWGDTYWGKDTHTCQGENHLGKLLMELRDLARHTIITEQETEKP